MELSETSDISTFEFFKRSIKVIVRSKKKNKKRKFKKKIKTLYPNFQVWQNRSMSKSCKHLIGTQILNEKYFYFQIILLEFLWHK